MNYNQFTIDYIKAIQSHLCIEINKFGEAIFVFDKITQSNIVELKDELTEIFKNSESSIKILTEKVDTSIQAGLFGLVDDLDKAIKVGFLIADRVVLIDYLFERILTKKIDNIDITHLGSIASFLVQLLPLAEKGRIVIIQNPFKWYNPSKEIIKETSAKTILTPKLMSMLNMLSIIKECKLHPYTIAESDKEYNLIINEQIDKTAVAGKSVENYAYEGILSSLLSEKLLDNIEFSYVLKMPISKYFDIISSNRDFYDSYIAQITSKGFLDGDIKINEIRENIIRNISDRNSKLPSSIKNAITIGGSIGGSATAILGIISLISAPIAISGVIAGLSPTLIGLIKSKDKSEEPVISVFSNLIANND